jgi:hypothetical protein
MTARSKSLQNECSQLREHAHIMRKLTYAIFD